MKLLIALLTAATGLLHLLVGFGVLPGGGESRNLPLILNGVGYLVLLVLYWTAAGGRNTIRWVLLAYTLITLVGYFVLNAGNNFGFGNTWALIIKAIELLLVILLFLDRGREPVAARPPAPATSRMSAPPVGTRSVEAPEVGATLGGMAAGTAAGVTTAAAAGAAVTVAALDEAAESADNAMDEAGEEVSEFASDVVEGAGEAVEEMGEAVGEVVDDAGNAIEEAYDATTDAAAEAVDTAGDAMRGGVAAVGAMAADASEEAEEILTQDAAELDAADLAAEPTADELRADLENYLRSFGSGSEFRKDIEYIEGIGAVYGQKLRAAGISTVLDLIVNGATRRGRKHISDQTGLQQSLILTWVNHIDLFRIKGVAQEYADLLEQSGVDTVVELAQRNPVNLHKRMVDINEQKKLVRRLPHDSEVQSWVEQAKNLRRIISY